MIMHNDVIHGEFEIPELIDAIIKSDMFQRLKEIQQLGCTSYHFSNANHTRYDHCIGTYFLAKKMLDHLSRNTNNFLIPEFYHTCVCIAALLHDIGHGPFSHYWEEICEEFGYEYIHENNCDAAIDIIFQKINYKLSEDAERHNFGVELIKSFIIGKYDHLPLQIEEEFKFLYDIVNNKRCGIDVDKWDYLLRDKFHGEEYLNENFDIFFEEVFLNARISKDRSRIEYNRENYNGIYNLFDTRYKFHVHLYQQPNVKIKERILVKAIKLFADEGHKFLGLNLFKITSRDNEFLHLTDNNVLEELRRVDNEEINKCLYLLENNVFKAVENQDPIKIKIENPGEKMKVESIPFYGKFPRNRIEPKRGFYERSYYVGF